VSLDRNQNIDGHNNDVFLGDILGKVKKGAIIRSKDDERESFALVCPCKVCFEVI